jgi:hypothetical protein
MIIKQVLVSWKKTNPALLNLSEDEMFAEWEAFNQESSSN